MCRGGSPCLWIVSKGIFGPLCGRWNGETDEISRDHLFDAPRLCVSGQSAAADSRNRDQTYDKREHGECDDSIAQ